MKIEELYEKIKPRFDELGIPMMEFEPIRSDEFISKEYYEIDGVDYILYIDQYGKISYGMTDGVTFDECGVLGYI